MLLSREKRERFRLGDAAYRSELRANAAVAATSARLDIDLESNQTAVTASDMLHWQPPESEVTRGQ
jgi:hypothetical protein